MQKKRFGRLKKAAIVLAVVGAASFLFMKKKPEPEPVIRKTKITNAGSPKKRWILPKQPRKRIHMPPTKTEANKPIHQLTDLLKEEIKYHELNCKLTFSRDENIQRKKERYPKEEYGDNPIISAINDASSIADSIQEYFIESGKFLPTDENIHRDMCGYSNENCSLELLDGVQKLKQNKDIDGLISFLNQLDSLKINRFKGEYLDSRYYDYVDMMVNRKINGQGETPGINCFAWNMYTFKLATESLNALASMIVENPEKGGGIFSKLSNTQIFLISKSLMFKFSSLGNTDYSTVDRFFSTLSDDDKQIFLSIMKKNSLILEKVAKKLSTDSRDSELRETAVYILKKVKKFDQSPTEELGSFFGD